MATVAVAVTTILAYAWTMADSARVEDVLFLANASLLTEPWRIFTSTFIHRIAPHFAFNLITLLWFGRAVERRYGAAVFSLTFFGALWTAHMSMLATGLLPLHGISGGVCGLYGLLLVVDWKDNPYRTIRQRPEYWLYPLALIALFIADRLGLTPVANLNHVVAILYGTLIGMAIASPRHRRLWFNTAAMVTIVITLVGAYRWEGPWRDLPASTVLNCSARLAPPGDVSTNPYVRMMIRDEPARPKRIYYIDADGKNVFVSSNSRRSYRLLPYIGSAWRVEADDGRCRTQFVVTGPGIIALD
jgi:membrane associated rhomboid family serine protease